MTRESTPPADRDAPGSPAVAALERLAAPYPGDLDDADPSEDLTRALRFLGWDLPPETVVAAGYVAGLCSLLVVVPVALLVPPSLRIAVPPAGLALALGTVHAVHRGPVALVTIRRTAALGAAPDLVARAVLRMRVEPTAESAATFAARSGRGPLADSLARHVRRSAGTPRSGLSTFADEWADWFPALRRSTGLVVAAADAPPGERARTLDRAMTAVLDGTRDRMAAFADRIRGPATALYAFGVLLPLALVAVVPAARVAGVPLSLSLVVVVYDLLLPAVVLAAGGWLLARRPVAFPPPAVDRSHPEVPARRWPAVAAGLVVALLGWALPTATPLPGWAAPLVAVGAGAGVALVALYRPVIAVRSRVREVESGLSDALYLVGRRVAEGEAVETAVERAAGELDGAVAEVLSESVAVGRRLRVDVRASLLGEHGALADVPSPRTRGAAALLATAAEEGRPAGAAVVAMADHLDELESVEREARRKLSRVTGTLANTGAVFAPLVGGATVSLSAGLAPDAAAAIAPSAAGSRAGSTAGAGTTGGAAALPPDALGLAVGAYVLFLAVALTALSTGLRHGLDGPAVGYAVGRSLLSAVGVYLAALQFVGLLL